MSDDDGRKRTKLYGAIDADLHPRTIVDSDVVFSPSPEIGGTLARFRIEHLLGRGGMGEVFSARDDRIGRAVAIKRLRIDQASGETRARFIREALIQGRLEHPAVVPVYELCETEDEQAFFVMKQVSGTVLADVLPKLAYGDPDTMQRYPRQLLLRAFVEVCLAVEFAHARGVIHRDLKPANIALGDYGEVYVLDWGIARFANESDVRSSFQDIDTASGNETLAGAILGTPGYISPEQIRGDADIDHRADLYSLGCILFEILALQPLHPRGQAAIASALAGIDARPSVRAPDREVPPELDGVCAAATALDREHRPASARALGDAVQRFLDGNRDLALRKQLAASELRAAHGSLASGDGPEQRRDALRAAARALALDPANREPADLVGSLMLEPPQTMPAEVTAKIARLDHEQLISSARYGMFAAISYLAFFPLLYWVGLRDLWCLIAGPAIAVFIIWVEIVIAPKNPYLSGYFAITGNLAMFALFAWMTSPILVGAGPAIMVMVMAPHRQLIRSWVLAGLVLVATFFPWLLELVVGPTRTSVIGGDIIMHTPAKELDPVATILAIVMYLVALIHLAALMSRLQDNERRAARDKLELQAWQLKQLVPRVPNSGEVDQSPRKIGPRPAPSE